MQTIYKALALLTLTACGAEPVAPLKFTTPSINQSIAAHEMLLDSAAVFTDSLALLHEGSYLIGVKTATGDRCVWLMDPDPRNPGMCLQFPEFRRLTYGKLIPPDKVFAQHAAVKDSVLARLR